MDGPSSSACRITTTSSIEKRARDDSALPGPRGRLIPWSPLARGILAGNRTRDGGRLTTRSTTDPFTDYLDEQPTDFDVVEATQAVAGARRADSPGGVGVASDQAWRDGADCGLDQVDASRRCTGVRTD